MISKYGRQKLRKYAKNRKRIRGRFAPKIYEDFVNKLWIGIAILTVLFPAFFYFKNQVFAYHEVQEEFVSPIPPTPTPTPSPTPTSTPTPTPTPTSTPQQDLDEAIGNAVDEFFTTEYTRSKMRATLHCLVSNESKHAYDDGHGDNGKAGGAFQFWNGTWTRMRKAMIKDGYANNLDNRYNLNEASRTTAYAFKQGWAKEWGPILRGECELPKIMK